MPRLRTLGEIRQRARALADAVDSRNSSETEVVEWINDAYAELRDLLTEAEPNRFLERSVLTATTEREYDISGTAFSPSMASLMSIRAVKYIGHQADEIPIDTFGLLDTGLRYSTNSSGGADLRYDIYGQGDRTRLVFDRNPSPGPRYAVYWIPSAPELTEVTDTVDGVNGWEDFIVVQTAQRIFQREHEGQLATAIAKSEADLRLRIAKLADQRNGRPVQVPLVWTTRASRRNRSYRT